MEVGKSVKLYKVIKLYLVINLTITIYEKTVDTIHKSKDRFY